MSNHSVGHAAEARAAEYLEERGFQIRTLNWKTSLCEIDIIAEKDKVIYFVEVKYRKNSRQGYGYEYVTPTKLKRMRFAADMWLADSAWHGECQLAVVSIDTEHFTFIQLDDA